MRETMKKLFLAFFVVTALTMALAGNALASFGELTFLRVIDQVSGGTTEVATNLGTVGTTVNMSAQNVVLSKSNVLNLFGGANLSNLTVTYTAYQTNPNTGFTYDIWLAGSNTTAPKTAGGADQSYISGLSQTTYYYNTNLGGADQVVASTTHASSYFTQMNPTGKYGSYSSFLMGNDPNANANLAALATVGYVDQTIWYFSGEPINDYYQTNPSTGLKVATIRTSYNAATGDLTSILNPSDTVPPTVTAFTIPSSFSNFTAVPISVPVTSFIASDDVAVTGYLITTSSTAPSAGDNGWTAFAPTTFTVQAPGTYTLYAWAKDAAGNVSASKSATVTVNDTTAPTVTAFAIPSSFSNFTAVPITVPVTTFAASDNVGVTGYLITTSSTPPSATASGWSSTIPTMFTVQAPGAYTLYAWAMDAGGNVSASMSATVTVSDTTAPLITNFSVPTSTQTAQTVSGISLSATDNVAVTGYLLTETSSQPDANDPSWSPIAPDSHTFVGLGQGITTKTLYAWAKDAAGNRSGLSSVSTKTVNFNISVVDTTPPNVTAFAVSSAASFPTVQVTAFTASDDVGVAGYLITTTPTQPLATASGWSSTIPSTFTVQTPGLYTLYAWAKDGAGNVSVQNQNSSATVTVNDTIAPTVNAFAISSTGFPTVQVTAFTASDDVGVTGYLVTTSPTQPLAATSGWNSTIPTTFTVQTPGSYTLYAWAKDAAGNVSASKNASITVNDITAPTVTAFTVPLSASYPNVPVSTFTASDDVGVTGYLITISSTQPLATTSGWSAIPPTSYPVSGTGSYILYAWAKDAAGHVSPSKSATVTVNDTSAPTITSFILPTGTLSNTSTVPINALTATDDIKVVGFLLTESSVKPSATAAGWLEQAPTNYTFSGLGTGSVPKDLYAWAKDNAGNVSEPAKASVTFYNSALSITLSSPLDGSRTTDNTVYTSFHTIYVAGAVNKQDATVSVKLMVKDASGNDTVVSNQDATINNDLSFRQAITLQAGVTNIIEISAKNSLETIIPLSRKVTYRAVGIADALRALRISVGLDKSKYPDLNPDDSDNDTAKQAAQDAALDVSPFESYIPPSGTAVLAPLPDGVIDVGDALVLLRQAVGLVQW